jgi:hypothetical protein
MKFIELLLHASPDGGSGSAEFFVLLALAMALLVFGGGLRFVGYAQENAASRARGVPK